MRFIIDGFTPALGFALCVVTKKPAIPGENKFLLRFSVRLFVVDTISVLMSSPRLFKVACMSNRAATESICLG